MMAALGVILRPDLAALVVAMAGLQLVDWYDEMPISPDHWTLLGFGNVALLIGVALSRTRPVNEAVARVFPALRLITLIAYSAAALAKYNETFTDPVLSCATAIADRASYGLAAQVPTDWLWFVTVMVVETSIPILLLIPRTRRHGVRIALAFHFVLSASPAFGVVDFTAALFALFFLFLSPDDAGAVLDRIRRVTSRSAVARDAQNHPFVAATVAFVVLGLSGHVVGRVGTGVTYVAVELYFLGVLLAALMTWRRTATAIAFGRIPLATLPVAAVLLVWVASPYLGSRTTGVFTMFSSLKTESDVANHLFLPTHHLTGWQDDLVHIVSSSNAAIDGAARNDIAVPLLQLRLLAIDDPELVVTGRVDGRLVTFGPAAGQEHLTPPGYWEGKLLWFRPVPVGDRLFCSNS
ncbi:hypothetical protein [Nocardioides caeni]|uniref:Uncharacterized protein n=1 Tax=Nocardioides caeni TaxID=574700 RepID=A0A4S8NNM0_9ACTN|nr:hypothetical protein [Nocardioides caeni]THV18517.1 hypothetical protein E9934_02555 [Nocardioides caeni]